MPCKFGFHNYLKIPYCQQLTSLGKRSHSCLTGTFLFFACFKEQKLVNMSKCVCCGSQLTTDLPDNKPGQRVLVNAASAKIASLSWFSSQVKAAVQVTWDRGGAAEACRCRAEVRQVWCCFWLYSPFCWHCFSVQSNVLLSGSIFNFLWPHPLFSGGRTLHVFAIYIAWTLSSFDWKNL